MALNAALVWELRATGSNLNGGAWHDSGGSSTDYSQQDAAEWDESDVVTNGTTTVTSATGGFTAEMEGNIINIATKGRFEIITRTDTNTITVDRNAAAGSGLTGKVGGAAKDLEEIDNVVVAGNTIYVEDGAYTVAQNLSFTSGTTTLPIKIIGYSGTRGTKPADANRPALTFDANRMMYGSYHTWRWLAIEGNYGTTFVYLGTGTTILGCKVKNTNVSSGNNAIYAGSNTLMVGNEIISTNGIAINLTTGSARAFGNRIHDGYRGIYTGSQLYTGFNIIYDMSDYGIQTRGGALIFNNTIRNCGKGIEALASSRNCFVYNNILSENAVGIDWPGVEPTNLFDYNDYWDNTDDENNVTKGANSLALDPEFTDPDNGDFSIGENLAGMGWPGLFPSEGTVTGYLDMGAVQRTAEAAAPGEATDNPVYFFTRSYPYDYGVVVTSLSGADTSGHPVGHAVDYKKDTYWETDASTPELKIDLLTAQTIDCLWIKTGNVTTYELYYSDDGAAWTKVTDGTTGGTGNVTWLFEFTSRTKRYWKVKVTAKSGNAQIYEVMLMELRLKITAIDNVPAMITPNVIDESGGSYVLADGSVTSFAGEEFYLRIDMVFEYTPKASRDNLYILYSTPDIRSELTVFYDYGEYPENIYRVLWEDKDFNLAYQHSYKGVGFGGTLRFKEY